MCILFKLVIFIMHAGNIFLFEHLYFGKFFVSLRLRILSI